MCYAFIDAQLVSAPKGNYWALLEAQKNMYVQCWNSIFIACTRTCLSQFRHRASKAWATDIWSCSCWVSCIYCDIIESSWWGVRLKQIWYRGRIWGYHGRKQGAPGRWAWNKVRRGYSLFSKRSAKDIFAGKEDYMWLKRYGEYLARCY